MKYLKTYESLDEKVYGYHYRYSKKYILDADVLFKKYDISKGPKKGLNPDIDPYGEEDWDDIDKNIKVKYKDLIDVMEEEEFPYLITFNTCGYMGCDVPRTYTKFIVDKNVVDGLKDPKCIGFNSDAPHVRNEEAERVIHQPGVWKLIPVYGLPYIWRYDRNYPLRHLEETEEPLKIYKEDWNKFVDIMSIRNYMWGAYPMESSKDKGIKPESELKYDDAEKIFKKHDFAYINGFGRRYKTLGVHFKLYDYQTRYVNFKDILNGTAEYINKGK
jgi:hypothetical protein